MNYLNRAVSAWLAMACVAYEATPAGLKQQLTPSRIAELSGPGPAAEIARELNRDGATGAGEDRGSDCAMCGVMDESSRKRSRHAAMCGIVGAFFIFGASFVYPIIAVMHPVRDDAGQIVRVGGHYSPVMEVDHAATLRGRIPAYFIATVGAGFIIRALLLRFRRVGG